MLNKTRWKNSSTVLASYCFLSLRNKPKEISNGCGENSFLTLKNKKWGGFCPVSCTLIRQKRDSVQHAVFIHQSYKSLYSLSAACQWATSPFFSKILLSLDSGASNKHEYLHYLQMECPSSVTKCPVGIAYAALTQVQNLNKLINSCGEREVEQVSGLLAVQGWSVPFQDRMWQCLHSCSVSPYCSFRG